MPQYAMAQSGSSSRRALEREQGFVVIKRPDERETLVEECLCFGILGGDRVVNIAQARHEDSLACGCGGVGVLGEADEGKEYRDRYEGSHVFDFTSKLGNLGS